MNERGYTLVEAWLVLSIIGVLVVLSQLVVIQPLNNIVNSQILAQFEYDFTLAQALALQHESASSIEIISAQSYEISDKYKKTVRTLPSHVRLDHYSQSGRVFGYSAQGAPSVIGRFFYKGTNASYDIKIQFGRGRIEIVQK